MLERDVIPAIRAVVGDQFENVWYQQDGAPAHFALDSFSMLNFLGAG